MELYLIRHGQSVGNVSNMIQGSADLELTEEGQRQVDLLANRLANIRLDALYSSPMKRALATAGAIARVKGLEISEAPWLTEMDTGHLSGLSREEVDRKYPGFWRRPVWEWDGFPGGESNAQFFGRVTAGYDALMDSYKGTGSAVAIVSHIATINVIICRALDIPYVPYQRFTLSSASLTKITYRPIGGHEMPFISYVNDTSHLLQSP